MEFEIWRRQADDGGTEVRLIPASNVPRDEALELADIEGMELVLIFTAANWEDAHAKYEVHGEGLVFHWEQRN